MQYEHKYSFYLLDLKEGVFASRPQRGSGAGSQTLESSLATDGTGVEPGEMCPSGHSWKAIYKCWITRKSVLTEYGECLVHGYSNYSSMETRR